VLFTIMTKFYFCDGDGLKCAKKSTLFFLDWSLDLSEREPIVSVMMHAHMFVFLHACFRRRVCLFACIFARVHVRVL